MHQERRKEDRRCDGGGPRSCPLLGEAELEALAERAADKAIVKMTALVYQEVGKSVLSKLAYVVGILVISLYAWAHAKGYIKW